MNIPPRPSRPTVQIREFTERRAFLEHLDASREVRRQLEFEAGLAARHRDDESFVVEGHCRACQAVRGFTADRQFGARVTADGWTPNWRERLVCDGCSLNNRQRAVAAEIRAAAARRPQPLAVWVMEQVTALYRWLTALEPGVEPVGSEYLGEGIAGGSVRDDGILPGLRHEDVEALSFADASFDLVVSNDVLEHVDRPRVGLAEVARVLRPGGTFLVSVPFWHREDRTVRRAGRVGGRVRHLEPPAFHANPISATGSLVFHDFGWDFLEMIEEAGLERVALCLYWSYRFGHLGVPQFFFRGRRPAAGGGSAVIDRR